MESRQILVCCAYLLSKFPPAGGMKVQFLCSPLIMEVVRLVEDAVLKTVGRNGLGGSIPFASANEHVVRQLRIRRRSAKPLSSGSSPAMFSLGVRQRWRVGPDCKSGASAE